MAWRWVSLLVSVWAFEAGADCPIVSTTADAIGAAPSGSLRSCLELANTTPGRQVITFDPLVFNPGRITLAGALPALVDPAGVRLEGPPGRRVVIDGVMTMDATGFDVRADGVELVRLAVQNFRGTGYGSGTGAFFHSVSNGLIEDCSFSGNQGGGVLFEGPGSGHRILRNTISGNDVAGVRWYGPGTACHAPRSVVAGNVFRGNNPVGTSADDVAITFNGCIDVVNNTFEGNAYFGLRLTGGASNMLISGNTVGNATIGVFAGSRNNELRDNRFQHDGGDAIVIGDGNGSTDNRVIGNVFLGSGSAERAVHVYKLSSTTRVFHNTFVGYRTGAVVVDELQAVDVRNNLFVDMASAVTGPLGAGSTVGVNGVFSVATPCAGCDAGELWVGEPGFRGPPINA